MLGNLAFLQVHETQSIAREGQMGARVPGATFGGAKVTLQEKPGPTSCRRNVSVLCRKVVLKRKSIWIFILEHKIGNLH